MKKYPFLLLAVGFVAVLVGPAPAQAASFPRCITTQWASHHYHQPLTARHTTCVVHGINRPAVGSIGYGGATVWEFDNDWYPSTWATVGILSNAAGGTTGLLVRSS